MFEEICKNKQLKEALDEYLEESDYTFIKEMINPPKSKFVRLFINLFSLP